MLQNLKFSHKILIAASLVVIAILSLFSVYNDVRQGAYIENELIHGDSRLNFYAVASDAHLGVAAGVTRQAFGVANRHEGECALGRSAMQITIATTVICPNALNLNHLSARGHGGLEPVIVRGVIGEWRKTIEANANTHHVEMGFGVADRTIRCGQVTN